MRVFDVAVLSVPPPPRQENYHMTSLGITTKLSRPSLVVEGARRMLPPVLQQVDGESSILHGAAAFILLLTSLRHL